MNKQGSIIVIEDDSEDQEIILEIFKKLAFENDIIFFSEGDLALQYLNAPDSKPPFLILSDVNMPKMDGFELRKQIHTNELLSRKCIPFLFFTTGVNKRYVFDAYTLSVQGFFQKPNSIDELENVLKIIIQYWQKCIAPSEYLT